MLMHRSCIFKLSAQFTEYYVGKLLQLRTNLHARKYCVSRLCFSRLAVPPDYRKGYCDISSLVRVAP